MAKEKEEKLSFSFSSKSSTSSRSKPPKRPQSFADSHEDNHNDSSKSQFVTVFDPSQTLDSSAAPKLVIAPIPNSDFRGAVIKKMKNLIPNSEGGDPQNPNPEETATRFVLDSNSSAAPSDNIGYGLTVRSNPQDPQVEPKPHREDLTLKRFKQDMESLPEDRGMDEFADVPVESFAAAILAGYGWTEGKAIGRRHQEDTKVVQYDRRAGTQGLGYNPSANDPILKSKKGRESVYKANPKAEALPRTVRVVSGRYIGMKGEILRRKEGSKVVVRLAESGEEIRVDDDMVAELGSAAEEKCLRKLKELEIRDTKERKERKREDGDKNEKKGQSSDSRTRDSKERSPVRWLASHIRVRIVSKNFKGGKWYLKKGEVVDVVGPTTCDITMDGSRELLQGVGQEILETALPKSGGSVLVLYGRHKGVYGSLVERDMDEEKGVVRDADSHELINVKLEQIAEYVGDPSYLGY